MRKQDYVKVNGYSNIYFGWGAEGKRDDVVRQIIAQFV
jgi:hypothetical protein